MFTYFQIRTALKKLSSKATKNDILSELFKYSSLQSQTAEPSESSSNFERPKSISFQQVSVCF